MTAEEYQLQGGMAAPKLSNSPYPADIGHGAGVGSRKVHAGQVGTLRTATRARTRSPGSRSSSLPGRHAAAREAAREQKLVEEHYARRRAESPSVRGQPLSPRTPRSPLNIAAAPAQKHVKKDYGKFDYGLKREQPYVKRDSASGTAIINPSSTGRTRTPSPKAGSRRSHSRHEMQPVRNDVSPARAMPMKPTGPGLWAELCKLAQYDFTCEELSRLHTRSLVNLAMFYGMSADPMGGDLFLLEEHHAAVQAGTVGIRPVSPPGQPRTNERQQQDTWAAQSQQTKEYTHLDYGVKREVPATKRHPQTDRPVVTKRQQIDYRESTRSMRSA